MPMEKDRCLWKCCRIRSTERFCQYGCITTGIRSYHPSFYFLQSLSCSLSDALMEECVRMMQQTFRDTSSMKKRVKSVYNQRNLGTIKERKKEKQQETETKPTSELTIMRILRMRPRTQEFITEQLQIMATMQAEQEKNMREAEERKAKRQQRKEHVPPLPSLPENQ